MIAANIIWYIGAFRPYYMWQKEMKQQPEYKDGLILDEDGYTYGVHFPTYLYWMDGNLSIASPLEPIEEMEDGKKSYATSSGLIIWTKYFSGEVDEVGVLLLQDGVLYQIYLVDNETARYSDEQEIVDKEQEEINKLFEKA